jgi:hypothetical protein
MLGSFVPQCRRSKRSTSKATRLINHVMEVPSKRQKVQHEGNAQVLHDPVPLGVNNVQEATKPYQILDNTTPEGKVDAPNVFYCERFRVLVIARNQTYVPRCTDL